MSEYRPTEYIVDFGDYRSNQFVRLNMALIEQNSAKLGERIVRCRDCKWFTPEYRYKEEREYGVMEELVEPPDCGNPERCSHHYDSIAGKVVPVHIVTDPNGFCAWAERRQS